MQNTQVVDGLKKQLADNLSDVDYDGPQRMFGQEILDLLVQMILSVLDGCLGATGSLDNAKAAVGENSERINFFQKARLKRELVTKVYGGSYKKFYASDGEAVLAAVVKTSDEASDSDQQALMEYVEHNSNQFDHVDMGTL